MAVTVDDALAALSRLCLLIYQVRGTAITPLPSPDARQTAILNALGRLVKKVERTVLAVFTGQS
jgi:hypothetical protein